MTNTHRFSGRRSFIAAGAALATLGSRRASAQAAKPLSFQLSWIKSIQYGGYFGGLDIGSFKAAGVDATFVSGGPNMDPVANVAAGNSQLGDRPAGALLLARDHDIPIRIIGAVFQKSPYSVISLASKPIATVKDMVGKTIAAPTSGRPLLVYLLQSAGLDPARSAWCRRRPTQPAWLPVRLTDTWVIPPTRASCCRRAAWTSMC